MAYDWAVRRRARDLFVDAGQTYRQIAEETGVAKTTLIRWSKAGEWDRLREQQREFERKSRELLIRMVDAARESGDPQQTYAAMQAAKMADIRLGPKEPGPTPKEVAVVLLDTLAKHPEVGPHVRRYRNEVIRLTLQEVDRMDHRAAEAG